MRRVIEVLPLAQDTNGDGLATKDWLIPLITAAVGFIGGLLGVVAGQRLSRTTQLTLEAKRDARELAAAQRQEAKERRTERHMTRAVARVMQQRFAAAQRVLRVSNDNGIWWPVDGALDLAFPPADHKLLAANMTERRGR